MSRSLLSGLLAAAVSWTVTPSCLSRPPAAVEAGRGRVFAQDGATAARFACALEREAVRLDALVPESDGTSLEVWVVDGPPGAQGICGRAIRLGPGERWRILLARDEGQALLGHELFHTRTRAQAIAWPAAFEEGLADDLGLSRDVLGDHVRIGRLLAAARRSSPTLALSYGGPGTTRAGERLYVARAPEAAPPLASARLAGLSRAELRGLSEEQRRYVYGVGYAWVRRWLGDEGVHASPPVLPEAPGPEWARLAQGGAEELEAWAASRLDPGALRRWAVGRIASEVEDWLRDGTLRGSSPEEFCASFPVRIVLDDDPAVTLNDDPSYQELVRLLWPRSGGAGGDDR